MTFERNIYGETVRIIRLFPGTVLSFWALALSLTLFKDLLPSNNLSLLIPELLIWSILAYVAHCYVLVPDQNPLEGNFFSKNKTFVMRFIGLSALYLIPLFVISVTLAILLGNRISDSDARIGVIVIVILPIAGILAGVILALFGTWLPATIMDEKSTFGDARRRGAKSFFWTLARLIIGPGLVFLVSFSFFILTLGYLGSDGNLIQAASNGDILTILINALMQFANCFATIIIAVVLSRAFLKTTSEV